MSDVPAAFVSAHRDLLAVLYARADAGRWGVSFERFATVLFESARNQFGTTLSSSSQVVRYLESLHLRDLALAIACVDGNATAWEDLMSFRPSIRATARTIACDSSWEELADSVFADLFGLDDRGNHRVSPLTYYRGRSKLTTWLRSVLRRRCAFRAS